MPCYFRQQISCYWYNCSVWIRFLVRIKLNMISFLTALGVTLSATRCTCKFNLNTNNCLGYTDTRARHMNRNGKNLITYMTWICLSFNFQQNITVVDYFPSIRNEFPLPEGTSFWIRSILILFRFDFHQRMLNAEFAKLLDCT